MDEYNLSDILVLYFRRYIFKYIISFADIDQLQYCSLFQFYLSDL